MGGVTLPLDMKVRKIAAGSSFVLGAGEGGNLIVMRPKDEEVLTRANFDVSDPMDASRGMEITHLATSGDDYALVVAEVEVEEEKNATKKPRVAIYDNSLDSSKSTSTKKPTAATSATAMKFKSRIPAPPRSAKKNNG